MGPVKREVNSMNVKEIPERLSALPLFDEEINGIRTKINNFAEMIREEAEKIKYTDFVAKYFRDHPDAKVGDPKVMEEISKLWEEEKKKEAKLEIEGGAVFFFFKDKNIYDIVTEWIFHNISSKKLFLDKTLGVVLLPEEETKIDKFLKDMNLKENVDYRKGQRPDKFYTGGEKLLKEKEDYTEFIEKFNPQTKREEALLKTASAIMSLLKTVMDLIAPFANLFIKNPKLKQAFQLLTEAIQEKASISDVRGKLSNNKKLEINAESRKIIINSLNQWLIQKNAKIEEMDENLIEEFAEYFLDDIERVKGQKI